VPAVAVVVSTAKCENYTVVGRFLGFDVGERRIGVAISDATGTLARPVGVLPVRGIEPAVDVAAAEVTRLAAEEDNLIGIVVGLPRHLDGSPSDMTPRVQQFARVLGARTSLPVTLQDERLTSREAESRLALREKDWRTRKRRLDAAAAAIILQDYLDTRPGRPVPVADAPEF
jgi:putative holliday junction resolvase